MRREQKLLTVKGFTKVTAPLKWWRHMSRYKKMDVGFRAMISHAKFLADQKRLEKIYDLQSGETLGI